MNEKQIQSLFKLTQTVAPGWTGRQLRKMFLKCRPVPRSKDEQLFWDQLEVVPLPSGRSLRRFKNSKDEFAPQILFVHGWESRGSAFYQWATLCQKYGFEMLLWDAPLHGDSPPASRADETNLIEIAHSLEEDIQNVPHRIKAYVGHSLGGMVLLLSQARGWLDDKPTVTVGSPSSSKIVMERFLNFFSANEKTKRAFYRKLSEDIEFDIDETFFSATDFKPNFSHLGIHDLHDKEVAPTDGPELVAATGGEFLQTEGLGHRRILRSTQVAQRALEFIFKSLNK